MMVNLRENINAVQFLRQLWGTYVQHTERKRRRNWTKVQLSVVGCQPLLQKEVLFRIRSLEATRRATAMPTLYTYQLLDKELLAILMGVLMTLAFVVVLTGILIKRCCSSDEKRKKMVPLLFIGTVELYFPDIDFNKKKDEIKVLCKKMSRQCFDVMSILLIPIIIIVGTMFFTFWNVYLVEEVVPGDCENNFDCFPKIGDYHLQQEPVSNCSVFELNGNVTYECYGLVFHYAEGLGAAGGILIFTAVFSKLYFALLVTIYNNMMKSHFRCCWFILYRIVWAGAATVFILFIAISVGVEKMQDKLFQTITYQIQFAMYALSLLVIVVSGVLVAVGVEIKNCNC